MLVFGVACWIYEKSQLPEVKRCLDSIKDYRVILVDGKWYDMEGSDSLLSIPELDDLLADYPNVERVNAPNMHEWETRNIYLERCKPDDILLWLDTDEWFEVTDKANFMDNLTKITTPMFLVDYVDKRMGPNAVRVQGIRYPSETRHRDRHNELWYKDKPAWNTAVRPAVQGIRHHSDKTYRSEEREKVMLTRNKLKPFR